MPHACVEFPVRATKSFFCEPDFVLYNYWVAPIDVYNYWVAPIDGRRAAPEIRRFYTKFNKPNILATLTRGIGSRENR